MNGQSGTTSYFNTGAVGFGTTNPLERLHVFYDNGANHGILIHNQNASGGAFLRFVVAASRPNYIFFGDTGDSNIGYIGYDHSENSMRFQTNNAVRMKLDSSGRVGIGRTATNQLLEVEGGISLKETYDLYLSSPSNAGWRIGVHSVSGWLGGNVIDIRVNNSSGDGVQFSNDTGFKMMQCRASDGHMFVAGGVSMTAGKDIRFIPQGTSGDDWWRIGRGIMSTSGFISTIALQLVCEDASDAGIQFRNNNGDYLFEVRGDDGRALIHSIFYTRDMVPYIDSNYNCGGTSNRWAATYTKDLYVYDNIRTNFHPTDQTLNLGQGSNRWLSMWCINGYIYNLRSPTNLLIEHQSNGDKIEFAGGTGGTLLNLKWHNPGAPRGARMQFLVSKYPTSSAGIDQGEVYLDGAGYVRYKT